MQRRACRIAALLRGLRGNSKRAHRVRLEGCTAQPIREPRNVGVYLLLRWKLARQSWARCPVTIRHICSAGSNALRQAKVGELRRMKRPWLERVNEEQSTFVMLKNSQAGWRHNRALHVLGTGRRRSAHDEHLGQITERTSMCARVSPNNATALVDTADHDKVTHPQGNAADVVLPQTNQLGSRGRRRHGRSDTCRTWCITTGRGALLRLGHHGLRWCDRPCSRFPDEACVGGVKAGERCAGYLSYHRRSSQRVSLGYGHYSIDVN